MWTSASAQSPGRCVRVGAALLGALALAAAACTGSGSSGGSNGEDGEGTRASVETPDIRVRDVRGLGKILVNAHGRPLYVNNVDTAGRIRCAGACSVTWRPFEISAESVPSKLPGINGTFSVVERPDGTRQLALTGRPLYAYVEDKEPGRAAGNWVTVSFSGSSFTWRVVTATGALPPHPTESPSPTTNSEQASS
ncbi:secreted repeat protein with Y-X4-D motif [Thermasporomyces composti]|uniref:Secreted repeat protein with Y-X4-D motif n=1 Tax=Thermasporomyces composti TaxID=696763 RepID=A0A3D9V9V7_THECX|nr:secreted repeat protein with Y-X4-D motif [Thermasporomyces composti]